MEKETEKEDLNGQTDKAMMGNGRITSSTEVGFGKARIPLLLILENGVMVAYLDSVF
jgi:hypothetical protein